MYALISKEHRKVDVTHVYEPPMSLVIETISTKSHYEIGDIPWPGNVLSPSGRSIRAHTLYVD